MENNSMDFNLKELWKQASWKDQTLDFTEELNISKDEGEIYYYLPECTYLGCLIVADWEDSGVDALFVRELLRSYKDGRLQERIQ